MTWSLPTNVTRLLRTTVLLVGATLPVVAQEEPAREQAVSGLALFLTWLPMLLFLAAFVLYFGYIRKAVQRGRRQDQHMERVEQLLERLVRAAEEKERE